jgi:hypothetical protein
VPFVGLAVIVGPLQTLVVFADLPLSQTVPWFWAVTFAGIAVALAHRSGRASLRSVPRRVVLLSIVAFLGQGVGVIAKGIQHYRGCLESDQFNYVVVAQFLMDEPYSTEWENLGDRPWMVVPLLLKHDRLGQSVLHGFFAVTAGREAVDLFFPTQLLGLALLIPAISLLGVQCGLSRRWTTWAALTSAFAPGMEYLVSWCLLSHGLCIPILMAFLAGMIRLSRGGGWRPLVGVLATFSLGFVIYTEFVLLFLGTAGAALTAGIIRKHIHTSRIAGIVAALVLVVGLNPSAARNAASVANRAAAGAQVMKTGCRTSVWVAAVWLHYEKAGLTGGRVGYTIAHLFVYATLGFAVIGGLVLGGRALLSGRRLLPSLACASLLIPPLVLKIMRPEYEYLISKLILTLAPILVLFLACGAHAATRLWPARVRVITAVTGFFLLMLVVQSGLEQRSRLHDGNDMGSARQWNDPDLQQLCEALRNRERADVVIALPGDGTETLPAVESGTVCYRARHHRIRLAEPARIWAIWLVSVPAQHLNEFSAVPAGSLIVRRHDESAGFNASCEVVAHYGKYDLVQLIRPGLSVREPKPE